MRTLQSSKGMWKGSFLRYQWGIKAIKPFSNIARPNRGTRCRTTATQSLNQTIRNRLFPWNIINRGSRSWRRKGEITTI